MRSKNYKPVSAVLAASLLAATPDAPAFEIKPIGCRGAEGSDVNTETLAYLAPGMGRRQCGSVEAKVSCNDTYNYLVAAMANQPVHEAITRMAYRLDDSPLDPACDCHVCRKYTRGYLQHLMRGKHHVGSRMLSIHNVHHYQVLTWKMRDAILKGGYAQAARELKDAIATPKDLKALQAAG